jgi:WXG100 family type VII secretion target
MKARLDALSGQFRGQAASAFETHWQEWHTHASGLVQALEGLGQFLDTAAKTIEDVDQQLAQGLG